VHRLAAVLLCTLIVVPAAGARPLLGVKGNTDRFQSLTGQHSAVHHVIVGWGQGVTWGLPLVKLFLGLGGEPMIGINARSGSGEAISPAQIAAGRGDSYLIALNGAISAFAQPIYIRPLPEMNGYWNVYCAYTQSGRLKPGHSTASFRKAFARIFLIVHGGPAAAIDLKLRALGMPPVAHDLPENPAPMTKVMWNPQGYGAPDVPGNSAQAYYPGDTYVDVVGNDLYDIHGKVEWDANERLYRAHPRKPFAIAEWGLWGIDDPGFVRAMGKFARTHGRLELLAYFESAGGSVFDLATKPRSRAAYRTVITTLG